MAVSTSSDRSRRQRTALAFVLLMGAATSASAQEKSWSFQGAVGVGPAHVDVRCDVRSAICDRNSVAKLASVAIVRTNWGAEIGYEVSDSYGGSQLALQVFSGRVDVTTLSASALYRFGPDRLPMQLRLGAARTEAEFSYRTGATGVVSLDTWQPHAGFTLDMPMSKHLALRWDVHATRARIAERPSVVAALTFGLAAHF